jgi:hypothetical protein
MPRPRWSAKYLGAKQPERAATFRLAYRLLPICFSWEASA